MPATRSLMALTGLANPEHPPLGKWLIGLGMTLLGDSPLGWRIMSALAGALLVLAGVMAARWLLGTRPAAVMTGALLLASPPLFVQARIAMLDIFMASFLMLAFWMMTAAARRGFRDRWRLALTGAFLGCAMACKWGAAPFWAMAILIYGLMRWRERRAGQPGPALIEGLFWLGPFAALAYLASFLPLLFLQSGALTPTGLIAQQMEMLRIQSAPMASHTY